AALLRVGLVVGEDQLDLGVAEPRQTGILRCQQIEIIGVVDDVGRGLDGMARVDADLRIGAGHRVEHPDRDILALVGEGWSGTASCRGEAKDGRAHQQLSAIHLTAPCVMLASVVFKFVRRSAGYIRESAPLSYYKN